MAGNTPQRINGPGDAGRQARAKSKGKGKHKNSESKPAKAGIRRLDRSSAIIAFCERLRVPSGVGQGEPLRLRPWQQKFIRDVYDPHILHQESGEYRRVVRRAILSIARKNGKTLLIAALALVHLCGPEAIQNAEIYSAANDREQAANVFRMAAQMVRSSQQLSEILRVVDSTKTIAFYRYGSFYRAISAEAGTKHGLNPTLVIFDELAQAKSRNLYDVLDTSMGGRTEPLFITISTQSNDPQHILSKLIDDGLGSDDPTTVCHLYAAAEDADIFDTKAWRAANPALGDFRDLADFKALATKAQRMPAEEPKFRNLFLNQRVAPAANLISRAEWMACVGDVKFEDGEQVYLALDLSSTTDLTALVMVSANADGPFRCLPIIWKPFETLHEHSNRDFGSGNHRYVEWHKSGLLESSPGRSIDPAGVATRIAELVNRYTVLGLAYDRWRTKDLLREFDRIGLEAYEDQDGKNKEIGLRLVPWGQGYKDMAPAIDALELAVIERSLVHPNNPVLNWNMANAIATMDPAGNRKIDKDKARFRIDGAVALAMVLGLRAKDRAVKPVDVSTMVF